MPESSSTHPTEHLHPTAPNPAKPQAISLTRNSPRKKSYRVMPLPQQPTTTPVEVPENEFRELTMNHLLTIPLWKKTNLIPNVVERKLPVECLNLLIFRRRRQRGERSHLPRRRVGGKLQRDWRSQVRRRRRRPREEQEEAKIKLDRLVQGNRIGRRRLDLTDVKTRNCMRLCRNRSLWIYLNDGK